MNWRCESHTEEVAHLTCLRAEKPRNVQVDDKPVHPPCLSLQQRWFGILGQIHVLLGFAQIHHSLQGCTGQHFFAWGRGNVALQSKRKYFRGGAGQGAISSGQGRETVNGNYMDNTCATLMITWTILGSIYNAGAPIGTNMDHLEQRWGNLETTSDNAATILTPYRIKSLYLRKNNMKNFHFLEPFPDQHYIWSIFLKTEFDCW